MRYALTIIAAILVTVSGMAFAADNIATLRGGPIAEQPEPPRMPKVNNSDLKQARNYPEQPPTIPHKVRGYQVNLNTNKCMTCHSRGAVEQSQAPMVSVTHFMDRDGQVLATISPRRYFCNQCHVVQTEAKPLLENQFVDVDKLLGNKR